MAPHTGRPSNFQWVKRLKTRDEVIYRPCRKFQWPPRGMHITSYPSDQLKFLWSDSPGRDPRSVRRGQFPSGASPDRGALLRLGDHTLIWTATGSSGSQCFHVDPALVKIG